MQPFSSPLKNQEDMELTLNCSLDDRLDILEPMIADLFLVVVDDTYYSHFSSY